jgi:hypothetical protein
VSRQISLVAEVPNRFFWSLVTTPAELNEILQYYQRSPANEPDPLSMLWHSKRLCDNLVGDLVSPNQMCMTSHTNLQLAEVSKPTPTPHNASNSSQSAARVTRRVCVGRGRGRIIPPEDLAIACSECKAEGVKDGKHADEVNKLPLVSLFFLMPALMICIDSLSSYPRE